MQLLNILSPLCTRVHLSSGGSRLQSSHRLLWWTLLRKPTHGRRELVLRNLWWVTDSNHSEWQYILHYQPWVTLCVKLLPLIDCIFCCFDIYEWRSFTKLLTKESLCNYEWLNISKLLTKSDCTTMSDCIYYMVNWFWSAIVVAPVVVIYWRGTWDLLADLVSKVVSLILKFWTKQDLG